MQHFSARDKINPWHCLKCNYKFTLVTGERAKKGFSDWIKGVKTFNNIYVYSTKSQMLEKLEENNPHNGANSRLFCFKRVRISRLCVTCGMLADSRTTAS